MALCGNPTGCDPWVEYVYGNSTLQPTFAADPDIAGAGVDYAFVTSSIVTLLFALAYLILTAPRIANENYVDDLFYRALGWPAWFVISQETRDFWVPIFEKVILNLSDQMLVTGLAMLIAGFSLHCDVSVYHVTIIADLVWFSSNVHLTTLAALKSYLRRRPVLRNWRVVLMSCMAGFLITITWWQGHFAWYESEAFPAQCLWNDMYGHPTIIGRNPKYWMVTDITLIAIFYPLGILYMFDTPVKFLDEWLYLRPKGLLRAEMNATPHQITHSGYRDSKLDSVKRLLQTIGCRPWTILYMVYLAPVLLVRTTVDSACLNYIVDLFWFGYSLYFLIEDRKIPSQNGGTMDGDENAMGFGQIVPILLLSSTVFVFFEACFDQKVEAEKASASKPTSSQNGLLDSGRTSTATENQAPPPMMSGGLQSPDDAEPPAQSSPQRVDTNTLEMGKFSQASGTEERRPRVDPQQRRPTQPILTRQTGQRLPLTTLPPP